MPTTDKKLVRMLRQSPDYYRESKVVEKILGTTADELAAVQANNDDIIAQLDINTATWGLDIYEKTYRIPYEPGKPYNQRRERIMSKRRGLGTVNKVLLAAVIASYTGGTVEITNNSAAYTFTIKFVDLFGIPENMADVFNAIDDIKPAHLAVEYLYKWLIWNDLDSRALDFAGLDSRALTWAVFETGGWV